MTKKKKKKSGILKKVLLFILILLLGFAGFIGYRTYANGGGMKGLLSTLVGNDEKTLEQLEPIQILLLGVSTDIDVKMTDTIIVATYNPKTQTASLLSIPRDTYVGKDYSKGSASEKINALYHQKGIETLKDKVNEITGLDIKYYMVIDNEALIKLVDVLGGVDFEVPIRMLYHDLTQDLTIDLQQGMQKLDGAKAEQLLRFRKNDDGTGYPASYGSDDIGRMKTQRNFMIATAKQTLQAKNIFKIREIIDVLYEYVETNLSISSIKAYIPYAVEFNLENLQSVVLPGVSVGPTQQGSLYAPYWFITINKKEAKELINELYNDMSDEEDKSNDNQSKDNTSANNNSTKINVTKEEASKVKIEILNGSGSKDKLTELQKKLQSKGYEVTSNTTTNTDKTTIVNKTNVDSKYVDHIKEILGGIGSVASNSVSSNNVDITIIIGKDYK